MQSINPEAVTKKKKQNHTTQQRIIANKPKKEIKGNHKNA